MQNVWLSGSFNHAQSSCSAGYALLLTCRGGHSTQFNQRQANGVLCVEGFFSPWCFRINKLVEETQVLWCWRKVRFHSYTRYSAQEQWILVTPMLPKNVTYSVRSCWRDGRVNIKFHVSIFKNIWGTVLYRSLSFSCVLYLCAWLSSHLSSGKLPEIWANFEDTVKCPVDLNCYILFQLTKTQRGESPK